MRRKIEKSLTPLALRRATMMPDAIEKSSLKPNPREGWAKDSQRIAEAGDDALVWPEFGNEGDAELVW